MISTELNPRNNTVKIGYLVVGLVFLGLATSWLLDETGVIDPGSYEWLLPAILLGSGLIGLFASLGKGLARRSRPEPAPTFADSEPVLDLTSDLESKLADHASDQGNGENR